MPLYSSIEEVVAAFEQRMIPAASLLVCIVEHLTEGNVDEVIAALPSRVRRHFLKLARDSGWVEYRPRKTWTGEAVSDRGLRAISSWLARHPDGSD